MAEYSKAQLLENVKCTLDNYSMLAQTDRVIVGLSGGADSVALLRLLLEIAPSVKIEAAHINHCLRGEESDADEMFVKNLCEKLDVKLYVLQEDVRSIAVHSREGIEECARNIRYRYFNSLADNKTKIATAHTLGDSVETVLFNITRGCSINGLVGIPFVRENIIRPIRAVERRELLEYLSEIGQDYRTDSSNFSTEYSRNRIRLSVIPELMSINNSLIRSVTALSKRAENAMSIILDAVNEIIGTENSESYSVKALIDAGEALRAECIAEIFRRLNYSNTARHIELVEKIIVDGRGSVELSKSLSLSIKDGFLVCVRAAEKIDYFEVEIPCKDGTWEIYREKELSVAVFSASDFSEVDFKSCFMCEKIPDSLKVRQVLDTDKFYYQGAKHSLKYLYRRGTKGKTEYEISAMFAVELAGEIVFTENLGASDNAKSGNFAIRLCTNF